MDRFDALMLFTRIVELGSFTQAASVLNVPRATATHAIKSLEKRLGARLLDRTTRQVRTTPDGQAFYERCKHILAELDDAETSLSTQVNDPHGTLRLDLHGAHATNSSFRVLRNFVRVIPASESRATSWRLAAAAMHCAAVSRL